MLKTAKSKHFIVGFAVAFALGVPIVLRAENVNVNIVVPAVCGNSIVEAGEQCDTVELSGLTCITQGFTGGNISCNSDCTLNTVACENAIVGNAGVAPAPAAAAAPDPIPVVPVVPVVPAPPVVPVAPVAPVAPVVPVVPVPVVAPGAPAPVLAPPPAAPVVIAPPGGGVGLAPLYRNLESNFAFWIARRSIPVSLDSGRISTLQSDILTISLRQDAPLRTVGEISYITLDLAGEQINFRNVSGNRYIDIRMPSPGVYDAIINISYTSSSPIRFDFEIESEPLAKVSLSDKQEAASGVKIEVINVDTGQVEPAARVFGGQALNPYFVADGFYGFLVPNGRYKVVATLDGYLVRETPVFTVRDNIINEELLLIKDALEISEVVTENITETAKVVKSVATERAQVVLQEVRDIFFRVNQVADNPVVENIAEDVVTPAVATVATVAVIPSLWLGLLQLLKFFFLQPVVLFGRKKKLDWGSAYNSLDKLPIDLATIRLVDADTGAIKQSRVTDTKGRFFFLAEPGKYRIEFMKRGFVFPSKIMKNLQHDVNYRDLYNGGEIEISEKASSISPNIAVDPEGQVKTPARIKKELILRMLQKNIAGLGVFLSLVSLYITPTLKVGGTVLLHILLYLGVLKFVAVKKPSKFGMVVSSKNREPVKNAVARLFTKEYNKLVATQITDSRGRFGFVVGANDYYITVERTGYEPYKSEDIHVESKKAEKSILTHEVTLVPVEGKVGTKSTNTVESKKVEQPKQEETDSSPSKKVEENPFEKKAT